MINKYLRIIRYHFYRFLYRNSPQKWAGVLYEHLLGKKIDWEHPKDINEKINWLKFNHDTTLWTRLSDKYLMREYVESLGYADNLPILYGKWDRAEDIQWERLPDSFVMKVNNGSGDVVICKDKSQLDIPAVQAKMKELLQLKFGDRLVEPHYNNIKPCVIAEEFLNPKSQNVVSDVLVDYKIWVLSGKAEYILVCSDRTKSSLCLSIYDKDWNFYPQYTIETSHSTTTTNKLPKPQSLNKMLEMAVRLAGNEPQVRVDFYEIEGKPYVGELTFTSCAGFHDYYSQEFLDILGSKCAIQ